MKYLLVGCSGLDCYDSSTGRSQGSINVGNAVHVLWRVLKHPAAVKGM